MAALAFLVLCSRADGRTLNSKISMFEQIPVLRPEYPVPDDSNLLFYVQRSVNANTVVYAANMDAHGALDSRAPVTAFWRWFNVDGHKKDLNFIERLMAYGVKIDSAAPGKPVTFEIASLPERVLTLDKDSSGKPEALIEIGGHPVRLTYVYLHVVEGGLMPSVPALDIFGIDKASGKAVQEHIVQS
jgi:Domain of unknown function (DUF4833)